MQYYSAMLKQLSRDPPAEWFSLSLSSGNSETGCILTTQHWVYTSQFIFNWHKWDVFKNVPFGSKSSVNDNQIYEIS